MQTSFPHNFILKLVYNMSVVLGDDPELEEEIDTSQIDQLSSIASIARCVKQISCGEVVAGEKSETGEEDNTEETTTLLSSFIGSAPRTFPIT